MGMTVSIHRDDYRGGLCIFAGVQRLTILNVEGPFTPTPDAPAAWLVDRGRMGPIVVPVVDDAPMTYVAFGGSFAASSDSRWRSAVPFYGAVAIHDWDLSRDTQTGD